MGRLKYIEVGLEGRDRCPLETHLLVGPSKELGHSRLTSPGYYPLFLCLSGSLLLVTLFLWPDQALPSCSSGCPTTLLLLVPKLNSHCQDKFQSP